MSNYNTLSGLIILQYTSYYLDMIITKYIIKVKRKNDNSVSFLCHLVDVSSCNIILYLV